jgi:hypothetical protein
MEIVLRPLPEAGIAEIRTEDGVMRGPDHEITITDCAAVPSALAASFATSAEPRDVAAGAGLELA